MPEDCILVSLGLPELRILDQKEVRNQIEATVIYRREKVACPRCGQSTAKVHDWRKQPKQDRCLWCSKVFTEPDDVFGTRRRSSRRFREYLGQEGLYQTVRRTARKERVGEGLVRRCVAEEVGKSLALYGMSETPEFIGVDEFSLKKRHIYNTVVCDLRGRKVMALLEGKGKVNLVEYLGRLKEPEKVKAVAIDMSNAFREAVRTRLPNAKVVVDRFHVIQHVNRVLDKTRGSDQGAGLKMGRRRELFKNRFTLLKAGERLTDEEKKRLIPLFKDYPEVRNAWQIKEHLRRCYQLENQTGGRA